MGDNIGNPSTLANISSKFGEANLQEYLKISSGDEYIKLTKYETVGDSTKGDSYLSTITRIKVEGMSKKNNKKHTLYLIVKGLPANIGRRKTFKSVNCFRNECAFYNEALPRLLSFQEKRKPKNPFVGTPRCFEALADGEHDFIVMEDLSYFGYKTANRQDGLDFEHCTKVFKMLGRFHALSLAMKDQEPEELKKAVDSIQETYYHEENRAWYADQLQVFIDVALDAVSKEFPGSIYEDKFKQFTSRDLYTHMIEMVQTKEPYAVISHGDGWTPNFLFTYVGTSSCHLENVCMIDFQLTRYASPVLDVSYFLYSCTTKATRDLHFNDFLQTYYESFSEFLTDLGSSPDALFPYKGFQNEIATYWSYGLGMSIESVPFSLLDESDVPDIDLIEGDEAVPLKDIWVVNPIKTKSGRLRIAHNVMHVVDNGFI